MKSAMEVPLHLSVGDRPSKVYSVSAAWLLGDRRSVRYKVK